MRDTGVGTKMDRIYVDTCVYLDVFEERKARFRDLDEFALNTFRQVRDKKYKLVISDWVIEELKKRSNWEKIKTFLQGFEKDEILRVECSKEDKKEAREMSGNWTDALHVILAIKHDCVYLVTRNINDFYDFKDLIAIILPESL